MGAANATEKPGAAKAKASPKPKAAASAEAVQRKKKEQELKRKEREDAKSVKAVAKAAAKAAALQKKRQKEGERAQKAAAKAAAKASRVKAKAVAKAAVKLVKAKAKSSAPKKRTGKAGAEEKPVVIADEPGGGVLEVDAAEELSGPVAEQAQAALGGKSAIAADKAAWIAAQFGLQRGNVAGALKLLEEGNTVPFIARYRKEVTGTMNEEALRQVERGLQRADALEGRRLSVALSLFKQGALTEELREALLGATAMEEVEDIFAPFKQKKKTRAQLARARGLAPLANLLEKLGGNRKDKTPANVAAKYIDTEKEVNTIEEALAGARDIVAEKCAQNAEVKQWARKRLEKKAYFTSKLKSKGADDGAHFKTYWEFRCWFPHVKSYQYLAIQRGESKKALTAGWTFEDGATEHFLNKLFAWYAGETMEGVAQAPQSWAAELCSALADGFKRLIRPSLEREWRRVLKERAEDDSFDTYRRNIFTKLLTPPLRMTSGGDGTDGDSDAQPPVTAVLGIDPAYRTGCKMALVDATGQVVDTSTVYPTPPAREKQVEEAGEELARLLSLGLSASAAQAADEGGPPKKRRKLEDGRVICSVGNATASRETEAWLRSELPKCVAKLAALSGRGAGPDVFGYCIVDEAGASVYSASPLAKKELPDLDVTLRGAVSIARRLLDSMAELVKIDPKSIGVGLYQHDVDQKRLAKELSAAVEDCVNAVGIDVNTASPSLLERVSGLTPALAQAIVTYREANGLFSNRQDLMQIKGFGKKAFEQAGGFLRIHDGEEALDATAIHPESYEAAKRVRRTIRKQGKLPDDGTEGRRALAEELGIGVETLADIEGAILGSTADPRSQQPSVSIKIPGRKKASAKEGAAIDAQEEGLSVENITPGMLLTGIVRNVVAFGAFVDIGIGHDGLLHISQYREDLKAQGAQSLKVNDRLEVVVKDVTLVSAGPPKGSGRGAGGKGAGGGGKPKWKVSISMRQ
eukprot:TRINITY_DN49347_c0_g1_i1.p1 TRINITY_DN49347_c0_g1~~TRINITY_DN49347_c0_g1_i1.p1  ORF type:complete len:979 (+),score=280.78 TRINITY_DN49347_c0_g1_i1:166-3102(+)